jgi:hypothetical protein
MNRGIVGRHLRGGLREPHAKKQDHWMDTEQGTCERPLFRKPVGSRQPKSYSSNLPFEDIYLIARGHWIWCGV